MFSAYLLMALYMCIQLFENMSKGFKVIERTLFPIVVYSKVQRSYIFFCSLHIV